MRVQLELVAHPPSKDHRFVAEGGDDLAQEGKIVLVVAIFEEVADEQIRMPLLRIVVAIEVFITGYAEVDIAVKVGKSRQQIEAREYVG